MKTPKNGLYMIADKDSGALMAEINNVTLEEVAAMIGTLFTRVAEKQVPKFLQPAAYAAFLLGIAKASRVDFDEIVEHAKIMKEIDEDESEEEKEDDFEKEIKELTDLFKQLDEALTKLKESEKGSE